MEQVELRETSGIKSKVKKFISDNFLLGKEHAGMGDNESFLEKGIIDSTGVLELVSFLETTFRISVSDEELVPQNLDSLNSVASYIERKMKYAPQ